MNEKEKLSFDPHRFFTISSDDTLYVEKYLQVT